MKQAAEVCSSLLYSQELLTLWWQLYEMTLDRRKARLTIFGIYTTNVKPLFVTVLSPENFMGSQLRTLLKPHEHGGNNKPRGALKPTQTSQQ